MKKVSPALIATLMLCYFTEGFVDLVGITANMVQKDLGQSHAQASLMPSMVFIWFLLLSIPFGIVTNRTGRKRMVLASIAISLLSLLLPLLGYSFPVVLLSMALLGISHVALQVSFKPMITNLIDRDHVTGVMSLGQFTKAIASLSGPLIVSWGAIHLAGSIGWRVVYPVFMLIGVMAWFILRRTTVEEPSLAENRSLGLSNSFSESLSLLKNPVLLLTFIGILCHVGVNVGMNLTAPKLLVERCGMSLEKAAFASSLYFAMRTVSSFCAPFLLPRFSRKTSLAFCLGLMTAGLLLMAFGSDRILLCTGIALVGLGGVNVYPIIFSEAILSVDDRRRNAFSSLLAMAFIGGAVFPTLMGFASDRFGQGGAVTLMMLGVAYLFFYLSRMKGRAA